MKIKSKEGYYVLLCDTSKYEPKSVSKKYPPLVCGVFSTRKEALEVKQEIKGCAGKHTIKKCKLTVEYD